MHELVNTVSAYGKPIIITSPQFAAKMANFITYPNANPNLPNQDLVDIRENGYIGKFRGTSVVVLPQSFEDETNTKFVINPKVAYVIPAGKEKIVKVAFEGDTIVDEWKNRDRSMEIQAYRKVGVGIVGNPHYWGIAQNTSIVAEGWSNLPASSATNSYTVVYNANGGTGDDLSVTAADGSTHKALPGTIFTAPATKSFDKWNTVADGTGDSYNAAASIEVKSNLVLYANWKA